MGLVAWMLIVMMMGAGIGRTSNTLELRGARRIVIDLREFWDLEGCSLEAWGQNVLRPVGTDWIPSKKPLLDAGWLSWGGPFDLSTQALKPWRGGVDRGLARICWRCPGLRLHIT